MYSTSQFKKNLKVEIDGVPYSVVEFQHVSPGKGSAFTRTKLRNMITGAMLERTYKNNEKLASANTEQREMQFLYKDGEGYNFMNTQSYDQVSLTAEQLGDAAGFLQENIQIQVMYFNERPIGVELPTFVVLKIVKTDPAFKGDTVTGGSKPATLETGAVIQVPFHIVEGDIVKVDTRDSSYVEKAK
jgi:elongation factor P